MLKHPTSIIPIELSAPYDGMVQLVPKDDYDRSVLLPDKLDREDLELCLNIVFEVLCDPDKYKWIADQLDIHDQWLRKIVQALAKGHPESEKETQELKHLHYLE
jgi:hypothetical protein